MPGIVLRRAMPPAPIIPKFTFLAISLLSFLPPATVTRKDPLEIVSRHRAETGGKWGHFPGCQRGRIFKIHFSCEGSGKHHPTTCCQTPKL
jgi:hypothetical protein